MAECKAENLFHVPCMNAVTGSNPTMSGYLWHGSLLPQPDCYVMQSFIFFPSIVRNVRHLAADAHEDVHLMAAQIRPIEKSSQR